MTYPSHLALLSSEQMAQADQLAIEDGTAGATLMENAGETVADVIVQHYEKQPTLVLCGPGNNGGDGFVIARMLKEYGWDVTVALFGEKDTLKGDAKANADKWTGDIQPLDTSLLDDTSLIVDALFGVGLARPIEGAVADIVDAINESSLAVVAVDIPTGVCSNTGAILGTALQADTTITFCRQKRGHALVPGKILSGQIMLADIGIEDEHVEQTKPDCFENQPALWQDDFPFLSPMDHKYTRGAAIVVGGDTEMTGASRLAAMSALRAGAGHVTIACPGPALEVYASQLTAVMNYPINSMADFQDFISDERKDTILLGPGNGVIEDTKLKVLESLAQKKKCIIDADAISVFRDNPKELFAAIDSPVIMTPHEGEFARLFNVEGDKISRTKQAAKISNAIIVLKGPDTVIASPDGTTVINTNAPPYLATAGSGDVLAGIITGLVAQEVEPFMAACMGVWIHSECANKAGLGLIAEDLPLYLPEILEDLAK